MQPSDLAVTGISYAQILDLAQQTSTRFLYDEKDVIGLLETELLSIVIDLVRRDKSLITQSSIYNEIFPKIRSLILRAEKIMQTPGFDMPIDLSAEKRKQLEANKLHTAPEIGGEGGK